MVTTDVPTAKWRRFCFARLLPTLSVLLAVFVYLVPALVSLARLKQVAYGGTVTIGSSEFQVVVARDHLASFVFRATAFRVEKWIFAIDLPAHFVDVALSYMISRTPYWWPTAFGPCMWHCWTYPVFALPAWFYIGRATDALFGRRVATTRNGIFSLAVSLLLAVLCFGFRFGITAQERVDQPYLNWSLYGLGLWSLLLLIPFAAWLKQKRKARTCEDNSV